MKKVFIAKFSERYGSLGLIEKGAPVTFDTMNSGMGIAHDCLEHIERDLGTLHNEFMALGTMLWIRGEGGYHNWGGLKNSKWEALANEAPELFRSVLNDEIWIKLPEYPIPVITDDLIKCTSQMRESILLNVFDMDDNPATEENLSSINDFVKSANHYITLGYREAKKRFKDPFQTCAVFQEIERRVNEILQWGIEEGDEVTITYPLNNTFKTTVVHESIFDLDKKRFPNNY